MLDEHARYVTQLDGLARQRERTGDHGLGGDDGGQRGQPDHGQQGPFGRQQVKRVAHCLRVAEDQRALAEVVQHQAGQHQQEPGPGDGFAAEVTHVCIECFGAGQRQHHRAQNRHPHAWVQHEELYRPERVECLQHLRPLDDAVQAKRTQHDEPQHHDRPE